MAIGFLLPLMLLGLIGLAIPIIIHLLNRRRYDVVEWGAMQFLQVSETTRRRLLLEELLLLVLRMGLIAVLVLALAAPFVESDVLGGLAGRGNRDVVLIFDGSASMGCTGTGRSAHDAAREWANRFLDDLSTGDAVAVLQARQTVEPVIAELTSDRELIRSRLAALPAPAGGCDWPAAVQAAQKILVRSSRPQRDIILLGDGQRLGWADDATLLRWELLANQLRKPTSPPANLWYVNLDPGRPAKLTNWSLAPLRTSRVVAPAGERITFRTALQLSSNQEYQPPHRLRLEVDGKPVADADLKAPPAAGVEMGQVPLTFHHRFTAGSHLVSVIVEPDPPPEQRPAGYQVRDHLPGDNRQELAVEVVPALPVLLVDGDARPGLARRATDFLRDALAPARDRTPVVLARIVSVADFAPAHLTSDLGKEPGTSPRVLVLANVPRLTATQQEAVVRFLASGGGVLVTLGDRVDARHYNEQLYRDGQGWLPARLDQTAGDESRPERAASPLPASFFHPALELLRDETAGGLASARFPRWWKVSPPGRNPAAALLTGGDPLLVEKAHGGGRVLLCTVPLDNSWRTNLVDLPAFVALADQIVFYLAGARSLEHNLQPGQPVRYRLRPADTPDGLILKPPLREGRPLVTEDSSKTAGYRARLIRQPQGSLLVYENTREPGVYRLTTGAGQTVYYVVQADSRESDLSACTDADWESVTRLVAVKYVNGPDEVAGALESTQQRQEVWWWFLLGVVGLLCAEVWLTRRLVASRGP